MQKFHDNTDINFKKYFNQANFIDYRTQPRAFKKYPHFFLSFNLDDYEELKFIKNIGKITDTKTYGKQTIHLRANPSAGGLYPCELYIQIRGVKTLVSGIYHYIPLEDKITLIHELSNDGLEYYFKDKNQKKFIFLISNAYFRSSWKYEKRAIRYLLLDTGHYVGSIYSALKLENINFNIDFNFDKNSLNEDFSFDNFENFYVAITSDTYKQIEPKKLRTPIVNVCACDYQLKDEFIEDFYKSSSKDEFPILSNINLLEEINKENLQIAIDKRRSIRAFKNEAISKEEFEFITKDIFQFAQNLNIEMYFINHNINNLKKGVYKNVSLQKEGDFKEIATKLGLNQKISGQSAFTIFFTSSDIKNYFYLYILCGFISQILYLKASSINLSSTGIGAYFDDECKDFFKTSNNIFYLFAIGK